MNDIMHPSNIHKWATASLQMVLIRAFVNAAQEEKENERQLEEFKRRHVSPHPQKGKGPTSTGRDGME